MEAAHSTQQFAVQDSRQSAGSSTCVTLAPHCLKPVFLTLASRTPHTHSISLIRFGRHRIGRIAAPISLPIPSPRDEIQIQTWQGLADKLVKPTENA